MISKEECFTEKIKVYWQKLKLRESFQKHGKPLYLIEETPIFKGYEDYKNKIYVVIFTFIYLFGYGYYRYLW